MIASGTITIASSNIIVQTEGAAASDDLDTINGGVANQELIISISDSAKNVVLKHQTGNIFNPLGVDITIDNTSDKISLLYDGTNWVVMSLQGLVPLYGSSPLTSIGQTKMPVKDTIFKNFIRKYGVFTGDIPVSGNIVFAEAFPNAALGAYITVGDYGGGNSYITRITKNTLTTSGFTYRTDALGGSGVGNNAQYYWEAWGY